MPESPNAGSSEVFLSYARSASTAPVRALADALTMAGVTVFLDEREIAYGAPIPDRVIDGLLGARVVVVFAEPVYFTRWYCQLEYAATVAGFRRLVEQGAPEGERVAALAHVVVALPPAGVTDAQLDALPGPVRQTNWAPANDVTAVVMLIRQRLTNVTATLRDRLAAVLDPSEVAALFTREAPLPQPLRLAALPGAPPLPVWVPLGVRGSLRDRFVGRADDLWRLHDALAPAGTTTGRAALTGALRGIGGVGKTQLAAEYLYRYGPRHYTGGVFWLDAQRDAAAQHHAILRKLDPAAPDLSALRQQVGDDQLPDRVRDLLADAFRAVPAERPVLLVLDGVPEPAPGEAPAPLETWCPAPDAAACLVTSRTAVMFAGGGAVTPLRVDVLASDAAIAVLTGAGVDRAALAAADWARIAAWVGYLPLALTLLHSAMGSDFEPLPPAWVLALATAGRSTTRELDGAMDALRASIPAGALRGVSEAFLVSYERLPADAQIAARTLGQFAPVPLPLAVVLSAVGPLTIAGVRTLLRARAFVTDVPTANQPALVPVPLYGTMHGVLADFLRARAEGDGARATDWRAAADALLTVMTPAACWDPASWPLMRACAPHAERVVATGAEDAVADAATVVELALSLGMTLAAQGEAARARPIDETALRVATARLGPEHPDTLTSASNLALTLLSQGDLAGARALQKRVLEARTRVLGAEHPDTLTSASNLALTLLSQGDVAGARALHERVLEARTSALGAEHPATLRSANNLAETLRAQLDLAGARALQERVLEASTRVLRTEDPDTLRAAHNLAGTLRAQSDLAAARALGERVLEARTRVLGPEHPDTLTSAHSLADTLSAQGDLAAARALGERVLEALTRVLGPEHPNTLRTAHNLARTLRAQSDLAAARALQERVLEALTRVLGPEHPDTLTSGANLAETLSAQGNLAAARALRERVLEARTRVLGPEHPDTLTSGANLAETLSAQGNLAAARALRERVLEARTRVLGPEHPDTLTSAHNLASTLAAQGDLAAARGHLETAYHGRARALGAAHQDTRTSRAGLRLVLRALGDAAVADALDAV